MKVLVTGATGFVGREVVQQLHDAGHEVHFLTRRPTSASARAVEWGFDGQVHFGDVLDAQSVLEAAKGRDSVIHLVGIISEVGDQTFENVHTRGTRNVVSAAKQAGARRFVHMSALGTRPDAASRYHQSKWAAEEIVRGSGLDFTIFRPSIIFGPGDGFVNLFAKIIRRSPIVPLIGGGRTRFQPVPVEDVAAAFVKSLTEPRAVGQTFDLCGTETLTLNEIVDAILVVMKRRRLKVHIPFPIARAQAAFLEFAFRYPLRELRKAPPLNRDQVLMLREDNVGDGKPAMELFGLKPVHFREGIARYLKR